MLDYLRIRLTQPSSYALAYAGAELGKKFVMFYIVSIFQAD